MEATLVPNVKICCIRSVGEARLAIDAAIDEVAPFGVDVCSGLRPKGALDAKRLQAFMHEARKRG